MKKALIINIGIPSIVIALIINLVPDTGTKILFSVVLGMLLYGYSWTKTQIGNIWGEVVIGAVVGAFLAICINQIDNSLVIMADFPDKLCYDLCLSLKWILPVVINVYYNIDSWKTLTNYNKKAN